MAIAAAVVELRHHLIASLTAVLTLLREHAAMTMVVATLVTLAELLGDGRSSSSTSHTRPVCNIVGSREETILVKQFTLAVLPLHSADVAELVLAETAVMAEVSVGTKGCVVEIYERDVVAAHGELNKLVTATTLLVSFFSGVCPHFLHFLVLRACTIVEILFAKRTSYSVASRAVSLGGVVYIGFNVLRAVRIMAVNWHRVVKLLLVCLKRDFELIIDDIANIFPRNRLAATAWWVKGPISHGVLAQVLNTYFAVVVVTRSANILLRNRMIVAPHTLVSRDRKGQCLWETSSSAVGLQLCFVELQCDIAIPRTPAWVGSSFLEFCKIFELEADAHLCGQIVHLVEDARLICHIEGESLVWTAADGG